jgi:hypothetical protein
MSKIAMTSSVPLNFADLGVVERLTIAKILLEEEDEREMEGYFYACWQDGSKYKYGCRGALLRGGKENEY